MGVAARLALVFKPRLLDGSPVVRCAENLRAPSDVRERSTHNRTGGPAEGDLTRVFFIGVRGR